MWILTIYSNPEIAGDESFQSTYRLVGASEYTIGRKGCIINLPQDDPSISRHHATIIVSATPAIHLNKPTTFFPKVHVIDFSKHGTIINGVNVPPLTKKEAASSGATIIFGRSVVGVLHFAPLICFISKTVHPHIAEQLKVEIGQLCGFVTESEGDYSSVENKAMIAPCWTQGELREAGVSPSAFLFIAEGLVPEKGLMNALLERYCLVSPAYIPALTRGVKDTPGIPLASLPPPSSAEAPRDEALEHVPYRRPEPQIFDALEFSRSAALNPSSTFRTLHFIFVENDVYNLYHDAIERGGGKASFVTAYDVMSWYQRNNAAVANKSIANFSPSSRKDRSVSSSMKNTDITPPPADSAFPLRYLLQDRDAHGTNTFIIASHRAFVATLNLIQEGIEEGAVTTKKANRTIVQLPQPTGTIADALALLYLKARLPLVRDKNIMFGLYSEDASFFVAGHTAENSPTNRHMNDPETMHFEFTDPSIAASALQVELEEASLSGLLHAPKRNTNYLQTSASRERERKLKNAAKRGKIASPSLLMTSALDAHNGNHDEIGNSPDSSVSTVDNVRAYQGTAAAAANLVNQNNSNNINNNQQQPSTPLRSALAGSAGSTPTSKQIKFGEFNSNPNDDGLNDDSGIPRNNTSSYLSNGSFSKRQQIVCCQPERLFSHPTLTPRRERDLILRKQQEQEANNNYTVNTTNSSDALYAKWQSFYDASREGEMVRAQQMYERKQMDGGSVGRRRAASPALSNLAVTSNKIVSVNNNNNNNNNNMNGGGGGASVISVGRSYSPHAAAKIQYSHRPIGSPKKDVPFAVSQSSLTRGGSPSMTHKRAVYGDVNLPQSAPFAAKALSPQNSSSVPFVRSNSPVIVSSSSATPRLLMALNPSNVDHRLLQYCQELETHSLPEVETEVLHANSQHSQGLIYGNIDLLKQRVMRYLVDIDLLLSESKRLGGGVGVRRAVSPMPTNRAGSSPSRARSPVVQQQQQQQQPRSGSQQPRTNSPNSRQPSSMSAIVALKSPVMKVTTNDAHRLAIDCKSRVSVLMTVLEGPDFHSRHQQQQQQQNVAVNRNFNRHSSVSASRNNSNIVVSSQQIDSSKRGYYNFENVDDDRERQELRKIEDALHSPRGSSRVAQERAASQATAQRMLSHPRTTNTPNIPFNTSLLNIKKS